MAAFAALVVAVALLLGAMVGAPGPLAAAGLAIALGISIGSYLYSDRVALRITGAAPADAEAYPRYHNLVEGLCVAAGLPKPDLYVIDDDAPNAFATGRNAQHAAVAVTAGLLDKLTRVELEGALAHELSHIRNQDILLTTMAVTLVGVPAAPFGPLAGRLLDLAVGHRREVDADATGVRLTRYPPGLIAALEKLRSDPSVVACSSRATAHLWIESPARGHADVGPPLEQRIAALKDM